jgi:DNA repair photolyase
LELLKSINKKSKCVVQITLTTLDEDLCKIIEPSVCTTKERYKVLEIMRDNEIPTVVWLGPILPFINDTEENLRGLLNYCKEAKVFGMGVTLREGNREYFYSKLDKHFPGLKEKYQKRYGYSYELMADNNDELMAIFYNECKNNGIVCNNNEIFKYLHAFEAKQTSEQLSMF